MSLVSDTPNPTLSGSSPTLTCPVEFDPEVDVPVIIKTVWTGPDKTSSTNTVMNSLTLYTPSLEMEWLGPGGTLVEEGSGVTIMGPSSTTEETLINMLVFSNLHTSQGGPYTCRVNLTIPEENVTDHSVSKSSDVIVQCKY